METRAEQDLALIRRIMEESRSEVVDRGKHFVIWGTLPVAGLIWTYLFALGVVALEPAWVWVAVLAIGWSASAVVGYRDGRSARVTTLGRRFLAGVWVAMALTLTLVGLAGMFGSLVSQVALPGLISVILAPPVLLTALLTGEKWLGWVAAGWWAGGAVMLFVPGLYTLLLMAVMGLLLLAVPGMVLNARARRRGAREKPIGAA